MSRLLVDGFLPIENGSTVSATSADIGIESGASGTADVQDTGSLLTLTNDITIDDAGSGLLSIQNDATVSAEDVYIAYQAGSSGTVEVGGTGSLLNLQGTLTVGDAGSGLLWVTDASLDATDAYIADQSGSSGTMVVAGSSNMYISQDMTIGATGSLYFDNSATGYVGTLVVDGVMTEGDNPPPPPGAEMDTRAQLAQTDFSSALIINSGTIVVAGNLAIQTASVGAEAGRHGTFEIGAGATLTLDAWGVGGSESMDFAGRSAASFDREPRRVRRNDTRGRTGGLLGTRHFGRFGAP